MSLYLSRIRLARSPAAQALAPLLLPSEAGHRRSAAHNLLWSIFSDGPERKRDFLWREAGEGVFLALSARPPLQTDLFDPHQVKEFAPTLVAGDRLVIQLRANATRMKRGGARVDVVMDALHGLPGEARAAERMEIAQREGAAWLARQGEKAGFRLIHATAEDYSAEVLPGHRGPRKGQPQFGILDLSGQIEVSDPAAFLAQLAQGFGRAKAFGCGLMLIRRGE
ncbi:type I-E CRISPR-associated protein Cas6/Cse3/CasE [Rhodobacter capsulatus]|uniref:Type I-E CRISPR-associated protein Cas6/Cse3/CasE n=1 Tax=Rhodobacter capsulatus TaxID=1061 RepID=A0A4U1JIL8_RHOCA|nr:type I-E CRISPR-associated protein Cas6/Cse3/CasE [Rhodobacter capsulatus]TKD12519.1 type I-E CRISPR-associated protein Cas6/Cse3/CasE [Rhodobacter capsulatus]